MKINFNHAFTNESSTSVFTLESVVFTLEEKDAIKKCKNVNVKTTNSKKVNNEQTKMVAFISHIIKNLIIIS